VTHLRKMMLEELQGRNYAETTISSYIRIVEDFSRRFQRPPDRLGPQHIREYQSELFRKRKLAACTVTVYLAALRFFYTKTFKKDCRRDPLSETSRARQKSAADTVSKHCAVSEDLSGKEQLVEWFRALRP
jgi:integrase/recombinase XerD